MEPSHYRARYRPLRWISEGSEERWNQNGVGFWKMVSFEVKKSKKKSKSKSRRETGKLKAKAMNFIDNWQIIPDSKSNTDLAAVRVNVLLILNLALTFS